MNKRLEEKLAMLAFGDLSPDEMTRLEQEVVGNPEAMRALQDYRGMRSGLKALSEIPEHQLSSDRLRHAVLNRGLKPKPRPQFGWLWMPISAFIVAGLLYGRISHSSEMPFPTGPKAPITKDDPNPESVFALATASGDIMSVAEPTARMRTAARPTKHHHRSDRYSLDAYQDPDMPEFDGDLSFGSAISGSGLSRPKEASAPQPSGAPIVLIDGSKDKSTGAQKATEVDSASNVVVGG